MTKSRTIAPLNILIKIKQYLCNHSDCKIEDFEIDTNTTTMTISNYKKTIYYTAVVCKKCGKLLQ